VTTPGGSNTATPVHLPTPAPTVTAISPNTGSTRGTADHHRTISRRHVVTIAARRHPVTVSRHLDHATTPAAARTASVVVTTRAAPTPQPCSPTNAGADVTAISPNTGAPRRTAVTITGTNFSGATS